MRVLADFHHQALYHSFKMLFEDRLGWELYRPIGPEWHSEGYWMVYNHPATVNQYLGLGQATVVPTDVHGVPLQEQDRKNLHLEEENGIYHVWDPGYREDYKAIRLQQFKDMDFDILISSIPAHIPMYNQLISQYHPKAKHIFQIGNRWTMPNGVENIMSSTVPVGTGKHTVFYHQEFDLNVFKYEKPSFHNIVNSYVHYMKNRKLMDRAAIQLPGWQFARYGGGMENTLQGIFAVASAQRNSSFTWQHKPGGDGYGHVIHGSYACGRPAVYWGAHYRSCLADNLFEHGVTGIDVERVRSIGDALKEYAEPDTHMKMCEAAYERFGQVVNFDEEFVRISKFLEDLR